MRILKNITFEEAIDEARKGESIFAVNITGSKPVTKLFDRLSIGEAIEKDYIYQKIEEVPDNE